MHYFARKYLCIILYKVYALFMHYTKIYALFYIKFYNIFYNIPKFFFFFFFRNIFVTAKSFF